MFVRYSVFIGAISAMLFCSHGLAVVELGDCQKQKKELVNGYLILQSEKGNCVTIKVDAAKQSESIKNMINDLGGETTEPIPVSHLDDETFVFVANMMTYITGKSADNKVKIIKAHLSTVNSDQLLRIIVAANFLDIKPLLDNGLDAFAHQIFVSDLGKLKTENESDYTNYKKNHFDKLPKDLVQLMIAHSLRSIDRVFVNHTKDRRQEAINQLDLATAQIVAYIANHIEIKSAKELPLILSRELEDKKFTDKILFGPLGDVAIWPAYCPLPNNPNYNMYSGGAKPDERYVDNKDETVTDLCTKLSWEKSQTTTRMPWEDAKTHCAGLKKANFADWRLPNTMELQSLVDYTKAVPAINSITFPNTQPSDTWTSAPGYDPEYAWMVHFGSGFVSNRKVVEKKYVRCVR